MNRHAHTHTHTHTHTLSHTHSHCFLLILTPLSSPPFPLLPFFPIPFLDFGRIQRIRWNPMSGEEFFGESRQGWSLFQLNYLHVDQWNFFFTATTAFTQLNSLTATTAFMQHISLTATTATYFRYNCNLSPLQPISATSATYLLSSSSTDSKKQLELQFILLPPLCKLFTITICSLNSIDTSTQPLVSRRYKQHWRSHKSPSLLPFLFSASSLHGDWKKKVI